MTRSTSRKKSRAKKKRSKRKKSSRSKKDDSGKASTKSAALKTNKTSSNGTVESKPVLEVAPKSAGRIPLTILATLAIIHTMYFAGAIFFPMALAVVFFFLLAPVVRLLGRYCKIPESVAAAIVVLLVSAVIGLASYVLAGPLSNWLAHAPETFQRAEEKLRFLIDPVDQIDKASEEVSEIASGSKDGTVKVSVEQPPVTSYLLSATMNFMAGATITIVLTYLLLAMGHRTLNSVVELLPTANDKRGLVTLIRDVEQGISNYLLTITAINVSLGLVIGTILGLLGFPDPQLLGIMAAALNFIPFVGCFAGVAITFLIGIVYLDAPSQAILGPVLYLTINILEGNVVTPMILGRSMQLNPAIVFGVIIFWGWVWGVGGILIAVPLLGITKIACDHFDRLSPIARILSG